MTTMVTIKNEGPDTISVQQVGAEGHENYPPQTAVTVPVGEQVTQWVHNAANVLIKEVK